MVIVTALLAAGLSGCASQSGDRIKQVPDPVFSTRPAKRHLRPTRRHYVHRSTRRTPVRSARPPVVHSYRADPGWMPPGGVSDRWSDIVIHHSASSSGGAQSFDRHHREVNHWDELGYHFVIGNGTETADGTIEVGPRWTKQKHGAHCKTPDNYYNDHGIGICLVGNFERTHPSGAQLASLARLLAFLQGTCHISSGRIRTHGGITGKTACPGRLFPIESVVAGTSSGQSTYAASAGIR